MEKKIDKTLIKKFYFRTEGEGLKCKFLNTEFDKFVVSDYEGFLYFYDTYLDSLIYDDQQKAIAPYKKLLIWEHTIVYDFDLTQDNSKVITGTSYQTSYLHDVVKMKKIQAFANHTDSIKNVKFFKNNPNFFISGGKDGKLNYYDLRQKPNKFINLKSINHESITGCDFVQDEKMIVNSETGTFKCFITDMRKLFAYDCKKKKLQQNLEQSQLIEFDSQIYVRNQLRVLNYQLQNAKYIYQPYCINLLQNFDLLKNNFNFEKLHQINDSKFKAITNIHLNHKDNVLFTKDNYGNIFQYDLNTLSYSQPQHIGEIKQSRLNTKIQIDQNLSKIISGIETSIYIWDLKSQEKKLYNHTHCHNESINFVDISEYDKNVYLSVSDDKYGCLWYEKQLKLI